MFDQPPFVQARQLSKRYGGVEALRHIDLAIHRGEVIGVVGDTNSGKSTLLRLLAGVTEPDQGEFWVQGKRAQLSPPHRAARYGIRAVHQDINIAAHMSALGYIYGGQTPSRRAPLRWLGWWDHERMRQSAEREFERLGFDMPPLNRPLNDLTSAQRKMVAFVHATLWSPHLLLLDEPMDALEAYKGNILRLIADIRAAQGAVLLVTQNLDDIFRIADRIVVLNAGTKIAERYTSRTTEEEIVRLILGSVEERMTPAVWALSNYFEVRRQAEALDRLSKAFERRAARLQAHAEVARSATSILDRDQLLTQIARIIQQRFGYYYTGIFLMSAAEDTVELRSSASRNPHHAMPQSLVLPVNGDGMIAWCAAHGQPRLANDVAEDPLFEPENTLPEARSELVLPLRIGRRVLGVLDLQSDQVNAFEEEDVQALQALADQLAIAIRNADLFEAAQAARRQADEANRYKSVFLSNMSHELRTPLSVVIGHTQAMLNPTDGYYSAPVPLEYRRDLETIRKSSAHLLALLNDILDLSKIEAGEMRLQPTVIDLPALLDEALNASTSLLKGRPLSVTRRYEPDLPPAWGDKVRTRQIVLNLLTNAIKFTEKGGITLSAAPLNDMLCVSVADTGIGIPEHLRERIFERFHQGDGVAARKHGGAGLGLSISQQLVELQHGRIWVESEVGVGSTFSFTIPRATPDQIAAYSQLPTETLLSDAQRMVIFQDDIETESAVRLVMLVIVDSSRAEALHRALEDSGLVVEQSSPSLDVADTTAIILPDLIVLDAASPDGPAVLRALIDSVEMSETPILVLGAGDPGILQAPDSRAPVLAIPGEPASPDEVVAQVWRCLAGR